MQQTTTAMVPVEPGAASELTTPTLPSVGDGASSDAVAKSAPVDVGGAGPVVGGGQERGDATDSGLEPTGAPRLVETGPGVTGDTVYIGVAYNSSFEEQALAAGASATVGDQREQAMALARALNRSGGIAGRQVELVFYDTRGSQGQDPKAAAEAACVRFTEDQPVFAAMSAVSQISNDTLFTCLARNGAIALGGVLGGGYDAAAHLEAFAPNLYLPAGPTIERLAPVWMDRLDANGYFTGWNATSGQAVGGEAVVGVLYGANGDATRPVAEAFLTTVEGALDRRGREVAASFLTTGDPNELNQAVLRFRQARVTHVIGDAALITFLPAAAAQAYRPRLGFASMSGPALMSLVAAPGQLNGSFGVGFNPALDVDNARDPGDVSPAQAECRAIMEEAGQPTSERLAWAIMALFCDAFNFLTAAAGAGGLWPEGIQRGAGSLGSLAPSSTFAISFPGGRSDGAAVVRDMSYDSGCRCFTYVDSVDHRM